jgi:hypothetical protein
MYIYSLNADVIGFAETCLNSSNMDTRNQVYDNFQRMWHSQKITFSAAHEHTKGRYQRGGTLQLTTGKLSSCVTSQGSNTMGRFCWQQLHMSNTKQITIITAYCVCQEQSESAGPLSILATMAGTHNVGWVRSNQIPEKLFSSSLASSSINNKQRATKYSSILTLIRSSHIKIGRHSWKGGTLSTCMASYLQTLSPTPTHPEKPK